MANLKIEYLSPEKLKAYASNAKEHPAEQIEQIKKSIGDFGFNDPIAIWKDGEVVEGHGRLIAALELGMDKVPVIRLDGLTDEQRKAYMLVHNKLTMNSGFNMDLLEAELSEISDIDMSAFGFDIASFAEEEDEEGAERMLLTLPTRSNTASSLCVRTRLTRRAFITGSPRRATSVRWWLYDKD